MKIWNPPDKMMVVKRDKKRDDNDKTGMIMRISVLIITIEKQKMGLSVLTSVYSTIIPT